MSTFEAIQKIDRPELGKDIPLLIFRAFRHFSADYVDRILGEGGSMIFRNGGRDLGKEIGAGVPKNDLNVYLKEVVRIVKESKIGLLDAVEISDKQWVLQLNECITCAGMDNIGKRICHFEVGFVLGIAEAYFDRRLVGFESRCNANGEGTCEVTVELDSMFH